MPDRTAMVAAMDRAVAYATGRLSAAGTYVWSWSEDLSRRRGEGSVPPGTGWIQPPGTPAFGAAFLAVHRATGSPAALEAARDVAEALVDTQLLSGGWSNRVETDPAARGRWCYRVLVATDRDCAALEVEKGRNRSLLDDDTTQAALAFLLAYDERVEGADSRVREALLYGLDRILDGQYRNGAWPNTLEPSKARRAAEARIQPAATARYPDGDWPRTWMKPSGGVYFILNDDSMRDTTRLVLAAGRRFGDPRYLEAARRAADFLVAARLPAPQRGWAQTYDAGMVPVWGRRFEPPAAASRETAGAIETLIEVFGATGDRRYLAAAREGADWLRSVRLADGRWSRFYELRTDRPLYMDQANAPTYEDRDLPGHYTWKSDFGIPDLMERLAAAERGAPVPPVDPLPDPSAALRPADLAREAARLVRSQDAQGRWVRGGWIQADDMVRALRLLARAADTAR
ncbi:hypothetical protein [Prosthecomicrobium sp. N25]|uniref:hypothetical protein n=1 Tax=Prosthecomicrobium sp. N25 TaxID=3129254 RepID=UPI00307747B3